MDVDSKELERLQRALIQTISDFLDRQLPLRRIVLVASLLKDCNIELPTAAKLTAQLLDEQHADGGWVDCEDTAWSLFCIDAKRYEKKITAGLRWLESERNAKSGWGFCKRDKSCIPITGQILYLMPHIDSYREAAKWIEKQWKKDLEASVKLNYKAAWYILACVSLFERLSLSLELINKTVRYLVKEQRSDGSWGPWKKHPAPSDYFTTGICMGALAQSYLLTENREIRVALSKSIQWLKNTQLRNSLFPTHYIEEGSSWAFWGWSKAISLMDI